MYYCATNIALQRSVLTLVINIVLVVTKVEIIFVLYLKIDLA